MVDRDITTTVDHVSNHLHKIGVLAAPDFFYPWLDRYVEGRLALHAAPPDQQFKLMHVLDSFLRWREPCATQHLLLLGDSGSGKTSAALTVYAHLQAHPQTISNKRVVSAIVPLTSVRRLDGRSLDDAVLTAIGVRADIAADLVARCVVVVILDSLDESEFRTVAVASNADQTATDGGLDDRCSSSPFFFRDADLESLLGKTTFCRRARVIVSCRSAFIGKVVPPQRVVTERVSDCTTFHVQPLSEADVSRLMATAAPAASSLFDALRRQIDSFHLSHSDRHNPVTLRIAIELCCFFSAYSAYSSQLDGGLSFFRGTRCWLHQEYTFTHTLTRSRTRSLTRSPRYLKYYAHHAEQPKRNTLSAEKCVLRSLTTREHSTLLTALQQVALRMLMHGRWRLPVGDVVDAIADSIIHTQGNIGVVDKTAAQQQAWEWLPYVPLRAERIDDKKSMFGFWHRSIGDYLCALAFWTTPVATSKIFQHDAFSQRAAPVLVWMKKKTTFTINEHCYFLVVLLGNGDV